MCDHASRSEGPPRPPGTTCRSGEAGSPSRGSGPHRGAPIGRSPGGPSASRDRGRCSEMRTPGQRVAIEPNGPRTSEGASGFGSHVSSWLGPPTKSSRITDRSGGTSSEDSTGQKRRRSSQPAQPEATQAQNVASTRSKRSALLPRVRARISRSPDIDLSTGTS